MIRYKQSKHSRRIRKINTRISKGKKHNASQITQLVFPIMVIDMMGASIHNRQILGFPAFSKVAIQSIDRQTPGIHISRTDTNTRAVPDRIENLSTIKPAMQVELFNAQSHVSDQDEGDEKEKSQIVSS